MANKHRGEVEAQAFGNGCYLRLTTTEAAELESRFGENWIVEILRGLDRFSPRAIKAVVELGLYNDRHNKFPADQVPWPSIPLQAMVPMCADAMYLLIYGKTGEELATERKAEAEKAEAEGKPVFLNDPPTTSPAGQ